MRHYATRRKWPENGVRPCSIQYALHAYGLTSLHAGSDGYREEVAEGRLRHELKPGDEGLVTSKLVAAQAESMGIFADLVLTFGMARGSNNLPNVTLLHFISRPASLGAEPPGPGRASRILPSPERSMRWMHGIDLMAWPD